MKTGRTGGLASLWNTAIENPAARNWILAGIAALALLIRLLYLLALSGLAAPPEFDGIGYDMIARNLLAGNGFVLDGRRTAFRPPGYPLFVALIYAVGGSWAVLRLVQALLGTLTALVTYRVALLVFSQVRLALLTALLVALHPVLVYLTGLIYPETLSTLLTMLALWLLVRLTTERPARTGLLLALGSVLGAIVLLRPGLLVFAVLGMGAVWWAQRGEKGVLVKVLLIPLVIVLFILPWTVRNYVVFDEFIPLATEGGVTFWGGNHPLGHGGHVEPSVATWLGPNPPSSLYGWPELTEKQSENRFYQAALDWILSEPGQFLQLLPQKVARSWMLVFGNEARSMTLPRWVATAYLLYPLTVLVGLFWSLLHWRKLLPIYCLLLAHTLTTLLFYGSTRQSALVVPAALILSAFALDRGAAIVAGAVQNLWMRRARQSLPEELE